MFDWIPLEFYMPIYYNVMLFIALITLLQSNQNILKSDYTVRFAKLMGFFLLLFIALYMGNRPVSGWLFGDMYSYNKLYHRIQGGENIIVKKDFLFNYFLVACTKIMNVRWFFLLCALIYTIPCYVFSRKYGGSYWYFAFFIFICSYMFWPYGTNGIRNGLGTSIFILSLCFYDRKLLMYALMGVSFGMHNSLVVPIVGFLVSGVYKNPKVYLYIWLAAIPLSLIGGAFWEGLFGGLGFGDDSRAEDYLTKGNVNNDQFASVGFRWDFLFYSSFAVFAGWYFIFKKKITDKFYVHLWGTYMIANAFWILVIRANFSNRFAYLSWFLMAAVIAYPLLRYKLWEDHYKKIGIILFIYFMFTYFMNVIK